MSVASRLRAGYESFTRDLRHGIRTWRGRPGSTLVVILTLAVGIGLNAAVFAVVDWVLLRPLPYPAAGRLVRVFTAGAGQPGNAAGVTPTEFASFATVSAFESSAALSMTTRVIAGGGLAPIHVLVARTAGDVFATFGVSPQVGRGFSAAESAAGAPVVVLSDTLWRHIAADARTIGRTVMLDGQPYTVVGVMPRTSGYPRDADVWRPLTTAEREDDDRDLVMIGRLDRDGSADRASLELATLARGGAPARTAWVEDLQQTESRHVRRALTALLASAALLLLIRSVIGARSRRAPGGDARGRPRRGSVQRADRLGIRGARAPAGGHRGVWADSG
jgi:putative ABC transport system permease protein